MFFLGMNTFFDDVQFFSVTFFCYDGGFRFIYNSIPQKVLQLNSIISVGSITQRLWPEERRT